MPAELPRIGQSMLVDGFRVHIEEGAGTATLVQGDLEYNTMPWTVTLTFKGGI